MNWRALKKCRLNYITLLRYDVPKSVLDENGNENVRNIM